MSEVALNCPIDRCFQGPPIVCADADIIEKGQVEIMGTSGAANIANVVVAAGAADGVTQRAVDIAANKPPRPDRYAALFFIEDCEVDKIAGDDAIAAGTKLWWSETDNAFCTSISAAASGVTETSICWPCATAIELSDDPNDKVRVTFDGRMVTGVAATA